MSELRIHPALPDPRLPIIYAVAARIYIHKLKREYSTAPARALAVVEALELYREVEAALKEEK